MNELVGNKIVPVVLGVLCAVLAVTLVLSYFNYSDTLNVKDSQLDTKNAEISSLNSQLDSKNAEVSSLNSQVDSKNNEIANLNSQLNDLQDQNDALTAPNLVCSRFDVNINEGFFMISGYVCNTGTETAQDVKLHVIAFGVDGTKLIDSYKELGSIQGKQMVSAGSGLDIYYGGALLDSWTITPEWSNMP
jgi:cell division protein FtsB